MKNLANSVNSLALKIPGRFNHPPNAKDVSLFFQITELSHLIVDLICMCGLDPRHQISSLGPICRQFLCISFEQIQSLLVSDVFLPLDPNMG